MPLSLLSESATELGVEKDRRGGVASKVVLLASILLSEKGAGQ